MKAAQAIVLLAALVVPVLAPAVQASHMTSYTNYPGEHDDLGSSSEPNFFGTTAVLGQAVGERTIDVASDGLGDPSSGVPNAARRLAPGCTDDGGRQASGLCGLWTIGALNGAEGTNSQNGVPARSAGVTGMAGGAAPGLALVKTQRVRFLDGVAVPYYSPPLAGVLYLDVNHKVDDLGARALLRALDPRAGGDFVAGQIGHWAWYGSWADLNGNGVIDHLQAAKDVLTSPATPIADPANEFQWYGNCLSFDGDRIPGWHCVDEGAMLGQRVSLLTWVYPGNHHGDCGFYLLGANEALCDVPTDYPGKQVVCFAGIAVLGRVAVGPLTVSFSDPGATVKVAQNHCANELGQMDDFDVRTGADPLLGPQDSLAPDVAQDDRTGDPDWDTRAWTGALGLVTHYWDQSLVTTTIMVTGANCADDGTVRVKNLATCRFLDVDAYPTWSPLLQDLVGGTVKPAARAQWTLVRDTWVPFQTTVEGARNHRLLYDQGLGAAGTGPQLGKASAAWVDPGLAREPNHPLDVYPGAVRGAFGAPGFEGFTNSYAGYRLAERAFVDNQMVKALTYSHAVGASAPGLSSCQFCFAGPGLVTSASPEPVQGAALARNHQRSLGPGQYYFGGAMGRWQDKVQVWQETVVDPLTLRPVARTYTAAPDGWVGNVVNATGAFYYKGYTDQSCTQQGLTAVVPYAVCHPYLDGNLADPQQDGVVTHGEWRGKCSDSGAAISRAIELRPKGGVWTVPVLVLENSDFIDVPGYLQRGSVKDYTGQARSIFVGLHCFDIDTTGAYLGTDLVVFPLGNLGLDVTVVMTAQVPVATGVETVVDADEFKAWGL